MVTCALVCVIVLTGCAAPSADTPAASKEEAVHSEPELRTVGPQTVAGFAARASFDDASSIGGLWQTFSERAGELGVEGSPWSVYHDYDSDYRGAYSVLVGLAVEAGTAIPAGWTALTIPRDTCLVFPVPSGPMPDVVIGAWQSVWEHFDDNCPFVRTYAFDYERHGATTEIFICVRRRE